MTSTVIDAGDGLPLTVPRAAPRTRARAGRRDLLVCDDDALLLRRGRPAVGRAGARAARERRRQGHARRAAAPERRRRSSSAGSRRRGSARSRSRSARSRPAPSCARCCEGADIEMLLERAVVPVPRLRRDAARGDPRARLRRARTLSLHSPDRARAPPGRVRRPTAIVAVGRRTVERRGARRGRGRRAPGRPHGHRAHVGLDQRAQGRDPHARRADPPPGQPQRDPALRRRRGALLELAVLLDRRLRLRRCSARSSPARAARVLERRPRRGCARRARARAADHGERLRAVGRAPRRRPVLRRRAICLRSGGATSSRSCRPTCGPRTPSCATRCSA